MTKQRRDQMILGVFVLVMALVIYNLRNIPIPPDCSTQPEACQESKR
jgi:hypothetical protein